MQKLAVLSFALGLFITSNNAIAQDFVNSDSLLKIWNNSQKHDTTRLVSLEKAIKGYFLNVNLDSAKLLSNQMLSFSKKNKDDLYQGKAYNLLGEIEARTDDLNKSIELFKKALDFGRKSKDPLLTSGALNNLGLVNEWIGNFYVAIDYYSESIKINMADSVKNVKYIAKTTMNIGDLFYSLKDFDKSLTYFRRAERSLKNAPDDLTGEKELSLAYIWYNIGNILMIQGHADQSLSYYLDGKKFFEKWGDEPGLTTTYIGIGDVHRTFGRYDEALENYFLALAIDEKYGNPDGSAASCANISACYIDLNDYKNARKYANRALKLAIEENMLTPKIAALELLVEINKHEGNYKAAFQRLEELEGLRDELKSAEINEEVLMVEAQFKYEQKSYLDSLKIVRENEQTEREHKADLADQEAKKRLAYWIGGAVLIIALLLAFSYFQKRKRNQELEEKNAIIAAALEEKGILLREISHRVKNNMQMISGLLHLKAKNTTDPKVQAALRDSQSRVDSMGLIHQKMYLNDNFDTIDITEYTRDIVRVLIDCSTSPEVYNCTINGNNILISLEKGQAVAFVIHELITNSLKHAWVEEDKTREINLSYTVQEKHIQLHYQDNGKGLNNGVDLSKSKTLGLKLLHSFAKRQLGGEINYFTGDHGGANFVILIKK